MSKVKAYGRFTKRGKYIYRTSTYLQWGESDEIIGACVLCNPGEAKPKERDIINLENDQEQLLDLDRTMKEVIKILEAIHENQTFEGRFHIYNLFTLRNSKMKEVLQEFNKMEHNDILYKDFEYFKANIHHIPWVLLAWGCEEGKR